MVGTLLSADFAEDADWGRERRDLEEAVGSCLPAEMGGTVGTAGIVLEQVYPEEVGGMVAPGEVARCRRGEAVHHVSRGMDAALPRRERFAAVRGAAARR